MMMNRAIPILALILLVQIAPTFSAVRYKAGYDPEIEKRDGVGVIAEQHWGEPSGGLQAAISAPDRLRINEEGEIFIVVRNVSDKPVRVSLVSNLQNMRLRPIGDPTKFYGVMASPDGRPDNRWQIAPGHQVNIPLPTLWVMNDDGLIGPSRARRDIPPGTYNIHGSIWARDTVYASNDGTRRESNQRPADEWRGSLGARPRKIEILEEEIEFKVTPPVELGTDHDLEPILNFKRNLYSDSPARFDVGRVQAHMLRLELHSDGGWLLDKHAYDRAVVWGPISDKVLERSGLLAEVERQVRATLDAGPDRGSRDGSWRAMRRVRALVASTRAGALLGFELAKKLQLPAQSIHHHSHDALVRTIRDRRLEFAGMGIGEQAAAALAFLTRNDAPLPDAGEFKVVVRHHLPAVEWGPEIAGLRAAALMPESLAEGEIREVRLFIRNTSNRDIFVAVSERKGYDYPIATSAEGTRLEVERALVYPNFFSSALRPETNPGQMTSNPPLATLQKLKLEPGAVFELETKTTLRFMKPGTPRGEVPFAMGQPPAGEAAKPALSTILAEPGEAVVTWRLHSANGAQYSPDLKRRLWPAKDGWSGLLETAAVKVRLKSE